MSPTSPTGRIPRSRPASGAGSTLPTRRTVGRNLVGRRSRRVKTFGGLRFALNPPYAGCRLAWAVGRNIVGRRSRRVKTFGGLRFAFEPALRGLVLRRDLEALGEGDRRPSRRKEDRGVQHGEDHARRIGTRRRPRQRRAVMLTCVPRHFARSGLRSSQWPDPYGVRYENTIQGAGRITVSVCAYATCKKTFGGIRLRPFRPTRVTEPYSGFAGEQ